MSKSLEELAEEAGNMTDQQLSGQISSLTRLTQDEINSIAPAPLDKQNLNKLIGIIKDTSKSNEQKAESIKNIDQHLSLLVSIVSKFI